MTTVADEFDNVEDFDALLNEARMQASTDWEEDFIADLLDRFERFGSAMSLSERQLETVRRIAGEGE